MPNPAIIQHSKQFASDVYSKLKVSELSVLYIRLCGMWNVFAASSKGSNYMMRVVLGFYFIKLILKSVLLTGETFQVREFI